MTTRSPLTWDDTTREGRALHWEAWNATPPQQRSLVGVPPCYTCGEPATDQFRDGSPRFRHSHNAGDSTLNCTLSARQMAVSRSQPAN